MSEPPLTVDELVKAKHGLVDISHRELAEAALYWYDEWYKLRLPLDVPAVLAEQEKEQRCDFGSCVYPKGHKGGHRFESEAYTP